MATNRSGFSIDPEIASEAELSDEIARLLMMPPFEGAVCAEVAVQQNAPR
jgi:hypothetical protein